MLSHDLAKHLLELPNEELRLSADSTVYGDGDCVVPLQFGPGVQNVTYEADKGRRFVIIWPDQDGWDYSYEQMDKAKVT